MDQWTHQWWGLYDAGLVSFLAETLVLDPRLGELLGFDAVHEEKAVFPMNRPFSSVPIVHIVGKALLVDMD
jgi:hypothetical protein